MLSIAAFLLFLCPAASVASACKPPTPPPNKNSTRCRLPARNDVHLSVGFDFAGDCVPSTGDLGAFMMFVDFSDAEAPSYDPPKELRDVFFPDAVDWYTKASYGALSLNVTADVSRYYRMPAPAASYNWDSGLSYEQHQAYIQDALQAYTANGTRPPPPETEVLYIVPTRFASSYMTRSIAFHGRANTREGAYVARKTVTFGTDPFLTWGYGALSHETGHTMCLPDYYPYASGLETRYYVGGWSAMGDIGGPGPDFFSWDKWRLGWLSDDNIDCVVEHGTSEHTLTPLEVTGGTKAVVIAANETAALVVEARVAEGLDSKVCAPGVLLYTVDTTIPTGEGPLRVLDANPSSGGCGDGDGELNDATLSLDGGKSTYDVPGWGITVKLLSKDGGKFKVQVDYS
ncbi:hypothetical protein B0T10DRAFT_575360 [Thelonectria olida]|uniref:M6 metalloprotease n=1 Tax=Thelonectria olida TaxID=1576542 RepID=A0A9P9AQZ3_9HYPO|nr:hypothetical protein B0T10DRAFT_575360 [Thelonectria olida]